MADKSAVSGPAPNRGQAWSLRLTLVLLAATPLAAPYVLFSSFTNISWFDDEGTILAWFLSLREGHKMYDEVYNLYGPLFSAVYGLLYVVLGVPLTHNAARLIASALWLANTAGLAALCYRLTQSLMATVTCYVMVLIWLTALRDSPGHPEELCLLLLTVFLHFAGSIERGGNAMTLAGLGAAGAGLALVKINIGIFVGTCGLLVLLHATPRSIWTRVATPVIASGLLLLPFAISVLLFDFGWVRLYCVFSTLAIGAVLLIFMTIPCRPILRPVDWLIVAVGSGSIGVLAIGGLMVAGSSAHAIFDAAVVQNARVVRNWYLAMPIGWEGLSAATLSVLAALAYVVCGSRPELRRYRDRGVLILKFGFVVLGLYLYTSPITVFRFLVPFCWIFMVPPAVAGPHEGTARSAIGLIAAVMSLYAFPVAGHQLNIATLLPMAMVPVLADDVLTVLREYDAGGQLRLSFRFALMAGALIFCLAGTIRAASIYFHGVAPGLAGTSLIRVDRERADDLRWVTRQLSSCASSYSLPGLMSFTFWTGHDLLTATNINAVLNFVTVARQEEIVLALSRQPDLCIVYNPEQLAFLDRGQIATRPPLLRYIQSDFVNSGERHGYIILRRRSSLD